MRVERYARVDTVQVATIRALWYGASGDTPGRLVLVRDHHTTSGYDLAIFTTDTSTDGGRIVERYADRWSIEVANATGKQVLGIGQARNRLPRAVERTVPFEFLTQTLVTYDTPPMATTATTSWPGSPPNPVHWQDRNRVRGHARQAPPDPDRRPIYRHHPTPPT